MFLRHPIDRTSSIYYYKRKEIDDSIGSVKARSMNLTEFVKWNIDSKGHMPMKNFQVLFLSNKNTKEEVDQNDLKTAINRMKSCSILGVVDKMDECLVIAEDILRKEFPGIDLAYVKQNVSIARKGTFLEKLKETEEQLGKDLMDELMEYNKLDIELGNTYSFGTCFTSIFTNISKIFSSLLLNRNSISLR